MLPGPDRQALRALLFAVILVFAGLLVSMLVPRCARAQLAVSDPPVEAATGDMDVTQFPTLIEWAQMTAVSLTTGGGSGLYTPTVPASILNQSAIMEDWPIDFPGWKPLDEKSTIHAQQIVTDMLTTYGNAMSFAAGSTDDSSLSNIETANAGSTAVLQAIQVNTEAVLALNNKLNQVIASINTLVAIEAMRGANEINVTAQEQASRVGYMLPDPGVQPVQAKTSK